MKKPKKTLKEVVGSIYLQAKEGLGEIVVLQPTSAESFKSLSITATLENFIEMQTYESRLFSIATHSLGKAPLHVEATESVADVNKIASPVKQEAFGYKSGAFNIWPRHIVDNPKYPVKILVGGGFLRPQSQSFVLPGKQIPGKKIILVNGINTSLDDCIVDAQRIQERAGGIELFVIYNRSDTVFIDLVEAAFFSLHQCSEVADLIMRECQDLNLEPWIFCHSQGADHTRRALQKMSEQERNRVVVKAYGPASIIEEELCPNATNYISSRDWIPSLKNWNTRGGIVTGDLGNASLALDTLEYKAPNNVVILEPEPNTSLILDHSLSGATYEKAFNKELQKCINDGLCCAIPSRQRSCLMVA